MTHYTQLYHTWSKKHPLFIPNSVSIVFIANILLYITCLPPIQLDSCIRPHCDGFMNIPWPSLESSPVALVPSSRGVSFFSILADLLGVVSGTLIKLTSNWGGLSRTKQGGSDWPHCDCYINTSMTSSWIISCSFSSFFKRSIILLYTCRLIAEVTATAAISSSLLISNSKLIKKTSCCLNHYGSSPNQMMILLRFLSKKSRSISLSISVFISNFNINLILINMYTRN